MENFIALPQEQMICVYGGDKKAERKRRRKRRKLERQRKRKAKGKCPAYGGKL